MTPENASNRKSPLSQTPASPRLGPSHMLIWLLGIAAYLGVIKALAPQPPVPLGMLVVFSLALGVGTAWAGGIVLILRAVKHDRWPLEPGHWLLGLTGMSALIDVLLQIAPETVFARPDLVLSAAVCWLFVLPLFSNSLSGRWKAFFLLMVALRALPLVLACAAMVGPHRLPAYARMAHALSIAADPIAAGSLLTTCLLDRGTARKRDWLHWIGIVVFLWLIMLRVVVLPNL